MKKIGIMTFHFASNMNFGASLQSFAVQNLMRKFNSEDVYLIDFNFHSYKWKIYSFLLAKNFREYNKKFLKIMKFKKIEDLNKEIDIFVVGSDQVWRTRYTGESPGRYYLDFVESNKLKIAYAASFGVDFWEGNENITKKIKPLAKRFNFVSVREESGVKICKDILEIDATCVLDPTLMISKKDYEIILKEWKDNSHKNKKYIAHMLLDDTVELREETKKIGKYLSSEINYIKGKEIKILGKTITLYNKVAQWLTYLKDAELVITDSFHCTVFSIIFNKKFVVVANPSRGITRLQNLLEIVGLKDRLFTNIKEVLKSGILNKDINYVEVEKNLKIYREYSMNFLKKALGEEKND